MPEDTLYLSKIRFNGTDYELKDAVARASIPTVEEMANVVAMLTSYGLNTTTTLSTATVGTSETNSAIVQNGEGKVSNYSQEGE